jgi:predicted type IV restriction endonuclease
MVEANVPKWQSDAVEMLRAHIRKFARPLRDLVDRDANEGDTRVLVTDMLCDALGYDKYEDLTTEYAVRGEFADYGVRIDKQLVAFVEVKRAAQDLHARHLRQVETYAVKEGVEWMFLTNGRVWAIYHVTSPSGAPIETNKVIEVDLLADSTVNEKAAELFYIHKNAMKRDLLTQLWQERAAIAPGALADVLQSPMVLDAMRKEVRKRSGYNPEPSKLAENLRAGVLRPELLL